VSTEPETSIIARIMASGYNRHVRDHGPDGDYAGEAIAMGDGHGLVVERGGSQFAARIERLPARTADAPKTPGQCWAALKDYLTAQSERYESSFHASEAAGEIADAIEWGAQVGSVMSTLAKMRELEAGQ
jgi:hypothetical protein